MSEPVNLQLEYRDDCLVIHVHGRDLIERMAVTLQAIATAIKARPVRLALLDLRGVPGPYTFLDRYQLGEMGARYLAGLTIGVLLLEEQADAQRIGQMVAINRGLSVEVFTNPAASEAWLKKASSIRSYPPVEPS